MVGIVIISHGEMANGMLDAAHMIIGEQDGIIPVSLGEADDVEGLRQRIEAALQQADHGDGVLILVDLFGATPFNVSARIAHARDRVEVITGMNLPMLLEVAMQRQDGNLDRLIEIAKEAGKNSIRTLSESLS